jgi:hypothetical protein
MARLEAVTQTRLEREQLSGASGARQQSAVVTHASPFMALPPLPQDGEDEFPHAHAASTENSMIAPKTVLIAPPLLLSRTAVLFKMPPLR